MVIRVYSLDMEYTGQQNSINYNVAMVIRVYSLGMEYIGRIGRPVSRRNT